MLGAALICTAVCAWAARRGLLYASVRGRGAASSVRRFAAGPVASAPATGVAFLSAIAALVAHAVMAAYFCVAGSPKDNDPSAASPSLR